MSKNHVIFKIVTVLKPTVKTEVVRQPSELNSKSDKPL